MDRAGLFLQDSVRSFLSRSGVMVAVMRLRRRGLPRHDHRRSSARCGAYDGLRGRLEGRTLV